MDKNIIDECLEKILIECGRLDLISSLNNKDRYFIIQQICTMFYWIKTGEINYVVSAAHNRKEFMLRYEGY